MDGAVPKTQGSNGRTHRVDNSAERRPLQSRRGHVQGLFEERAGERGRFVEDRDDVEYPVAEQALDRDLGPIDVGLDQQRWRRSVCAEGVQQRRDGAWFEATTTDSA